MTRLLVACLASLLAGLTACADRPAPPAAPPAPVADAGAAATEGIPIRVRIIQGSRKGPAKVDAKLADLKQQLGKLSYQRWEQVNEQYLTMADKKTQFVTLPDGQHVALTLQEVRGDTLTFEVALAQRNTMSRLTIDKVKRIVHQVTGEKSGVAYFVTVHAWP
jgi:TolA-binding protein